MSLQRKRLKIGFAILVVGAILLPISQIPLKTEYYELIDTKNFSDDQLLEFYWTFKAGKRYRLEVKGVDWTSTHWYGVYYPGGGGGSSPKSEPPWVWYELPHETTVTLKVVFWKYGEGYTQETERANLGTSVEISELRETTYQPTYLIYVGASLIIIGAAYAAIGEIYPPSAKLR